MTQSEKSPRYIAEAGDEIQLTANAGEQSAVLLDRPRQHAQMGDRAHRLVNKVDHLACRIRTDCNRRDALGIAQLTKRHSRGIPT